MFGTKRKLQEFLEVTPENTTNPKDVLNREVTESTKQAASSVMKTPTGQAVLEIIKKAFGSVYNILHYAGGPGGYLILGPSEAGKTSLIKSLYFTSQLFAENYGLVPIVWSTLLVFSSTAEYTKDLDWAKEILVMKPLSEAYLEATIEERKAEMAEGAAEYNKDLGPEDTPISPEEWAHDNPMAIILDDWNGIINATRPGNLISMLSTVIRKYGIYLFLLAQGFNQCGPVIKDNIRVILTLQLNAKNTKDLGERMFGRMYNYDQLAQHNMKRYHCNLFVRQWLLSKAEYGGVSPQILSLPPFPMYEGREVLTKERFLEMIEMEEDDSEEGQRGDGFFEDTLISIKEEPEEKGDIDENSYSFKFGFQKL